MDAENLGCPKLQPWLSSRFSFGQFSRRNAFLAVYKVLRSHGAQPGDVLSLFDAAVQWPVPARYSTHLPFNKTMPRISTEMSVKLLSALFEEACLLVTEHGYSGPAKALLVKTFGRQAANPLVFTTTSASMHSTKLFQIEYALALSNREGSLVVSGNHCFMRLKGSANISLPVGLYNRKTIHRTPDWLQKTLYEPRGYIRYGTFDSIDRCKLWGDKNLSGYEKVDFDTALLAIKGQKSATLTSQFEQFIFKMELPFEYTEQDEFDIPFAALLYSEQALEQIRFLWNMGDCPTYENYKELYEYLVPTYFSNKQFEALFQVGRVSKVNFNYEHVGTIDARFDEFVSFFKRMIPKKYL